MVTKSLVASSLIALCNSVMASEFTASERANLTKTSKFLESSCQQQLTEKLAKKSLPPNAPSLSKWLNSLTDSSDYCSCASKTFVQSMTPELLRKGNEEDGKTLMINAGKSCMVSKLKVVFPAMCKDMINEIPRNENQVAVATETVSDFCGCVQKDIELITVANYDSYIRSSLTDYATFRKTQQLPTSKSDSLLSSMQRCGLANLKSK